MNRILELTCAALLSVVLPAAAYAQSTQKLSANKANEYGLVYALPLTALDVTIEARKTVQTPGEFYQYARKNLAMTPITEESTTWTIEKVVVTPRGVADPEERYLVQFKNGSSPWVVINDQQFPLSINTEETMTPPVPELPAAIGAKPTVLELPVASQAVTEEMLRSTSTPKRAELAAARIIELRQNRADVISGQADAMPSDGEAMRLALASIAAQEEALTAMFVGTEQTSTEVRTYTFVPDSLDSQRVVVARLSATQGLVDADDLQGMPLYLDFKVTRRASMPVNEKGEPKRFPKGGVAYRIPGEAAVTISFEGKRLYSNDFEIAQAGTVFGLDPSLFTDKKAPSAAIFNPVSGAIVELKPMTVQ